MIICYFVYFLVPLNFSKLIKKRLIFIMSLSEGKDTGQFLVTDVVQQCDGLPQRS